MLYLVPTPIGSLHDFSPHCIEVLKKCDYILAEDTRVTKKLTHVFEIPTPLFSFNAHKERACDKVIEDLSSGKNIALVSDAGMPAISDPGAYLVNQCHLNSLSVSALPGPSSISCTHALLGIENKNVQFVGFLPKKKIQLKMAIQTYLCYDGVTISCIPARDMYSVATLLQTLSYSATILVYKEISKMHESSFKGNVSLFLEKQPLLAKGECTFSIYGEPSELSFDEKKVVAAIQETSMKRSEKAKLAASLLIKSKSEMYDIFE